MRLSTTVLIECGSRHEADRILEEMLHEGNGYLSPGEGKVIASPLMTEQEAAR